VALCEERLVPYHNSVNPRRVESLMKFKEEELQKLCIKRSVTFSLPKEKLCKEISGVEGAFRSMVEGLAQKDLELARRQVQKQKEKNEAEETRLADQIEDAPDMIFWDLQERKKKYGEKKANIWEVFERLQA